MLQNFYFLVTITCLTLLVTPIEPEEYPVAHWSLNGAVDGNIPGNPGNHLHITGGVKIHNGHGLLNGYDAYLDAGDYQGECISGKWHIT